jgi:hypothetical protein
VLVSKPSRLREKRLWIPRFQQLDAGSHQLVGESTLMILALPD